MTVNATDQVPSLVDRHRDTVDRGPPWVRVEEEEKVRIAVPNLGSARHR
jgi:hypothetical protein